VPFAAQTGLILPIGRWVLREACRCARVWQETAPAAASLRVTVNLSAKQLCRPELVDDVRTALQESSLAPTSLTLEVPEPALAASRKPAAVVLQRLRDLGVEVHLDDVGTASSLPELSELPIQGIKLDRTLVQHVGARRTDHLATVHSIVELARSRGLDLIAEGVETSVQRERLLAVGCTYGQGHLFGRPLEPDAVRDLLIHAA
jgi:EAL domain-containing protein (putative c-di-GMP-specific phosphodiesterase class I)